MLCGWEGNRRSGASHWPCVTDFGGSSTYGLMAEERNISLRSTWGMALLYLFSFLGLYLESHVQASPNFICMLSMAVARSFAGGLVNFRKLRTSGFVTDVKCAHTGQK